MIPTHQLRTGTREDITAWRYTKTAGVPLWVFRNFHKLDDRDVLTHHSGVEVRLGDWIVVGEKGVANVLTDEEFRSLPIVEIPNG